MGMLTGHSSDQCLHTIDQGFGTLGPGKAVEAEVLGRLPQQAVGTGGSSIRMASVTLTVALAIAQDHGLSPPPEAAGRGGGACILGLQTGIGALLSRSDTRPCRCAVRPIQSSPDPGCGSDRGRNVNGASAAKGESPSRRCAPAPWPGHRAGCEKPEPLAAASGLPRGGKGSAACRYGKGKCHDVDRLTNGHFGTASHAFRGHSSAKVS